MRPKPPSSSTDPDHAAWGILCDLDGTLVDTERHWIDAAVEVAARHGVRDRELPRRVEGRTVPEIVAHIGGRLVSSRRCSDDMLQAELEAAVAERLEGRLEWRPGARALLVAARGAEVPLAIVTSSPRVWVDRVLDAIEAPGGIAVVSADDVAHTKPHPEPYLRGAAAIGVDATRAVAIEDSVVGLASARAAGCATVHVSAVSRSAAHAADGSADLVVTTLRDVDLGALAARIRPTPPRER